MNVNSENTLCKLASRYFTRSRKNSIVRKKMVFRTIDKVFPVHFGIFFKTKLSGWIVEIIRLDTK